MGSLHGPKMHDEAVMVSFSSDRRCPATVKGVLWRWHVRGDDALFYATRLLVYKPLLVDGYEAVVLKFAVPPLFSFYYYLLLLPAIRVPSSTVRASGRGGVRRPK